MNDSCQYSFRTALGGLLLVFLVVGHSHACDLCAIYTATELQEIRTGLRLGVAEQFSRFGTLQRNGQEVDNPHDEWLNSSITQLVAGYVVHPRLLLQANLPLVARRFRRVEDGRVEEDDETGIGDISLHLQAAAFSALGEQSSQRATVSVGVKLPTGSASRLREELGHHGGGEENGEEMGVFEHDHEESGIHGHDLALGTGSTDVVLGAQWLCTYRRAYGTAAVQYLVRTEGSHRYRYANELIASGGPGGFLWLEHNASLGLQALLTVETKAKDELRGERVDDTGITALYVGPAARFTWGLDLSAELALDLPAVQNNTGLQIVPDWRVRAGAMWRF